MKYNHTYIFLRFKERKYANKYMLRNQIAYNEDTQELLFKDNDGNIVSLTSDKERIELVRKAIEISINRLKQGAS